MAKLKILAISASLLALTATSGLTAPVRGRPGVFTTGAEAMAAKPVVVAPACKAPAKVECAKATEMLSDADNRIIHWRSVLAPVSQIVCVNERGVGIGCDDPGSIRFWQRAEPPPPAPFYP